MPRPGNVPGAVGFGAYAALLLAPETARLLVGAILGRMQLGMSSLAILLLVHGRTGSFATAGLAVGAFGATGAVLMPFQGRLVDRLGQVPVLVAFGAGQSVAFVVLVVGASHDVSSSGLILLAAVAGALVPPLSSCMRTLWGDLAPELRLREAAYSLDAITQELVWTLGPLLVALLVTVSSPSAALVVCSGLTAGGVAIFVTSPVARAWHSGSPHRSWVGSLASGGIRALLACIGLVSIGTGILQVAIPAVAVRAGSPAAAGLLLGVWSVGSMIGGFVYGSIRWPVPIEARYWMLLALVACTTAPLIWSGSIPSALVSSVVAGLPLAALLACQYTLIGAAAPPGTLTESFAWNTASAFAALAGGEALGGWLVKWYGLEVAFASAAIAAVGATIAAVAARHRIVGARDVSPAKVLSDDA